MNSGLSNENSVIFTTGAFLQPLKTITTEGIEVWIWHVTEFVDDSYLNGKCFNPPEFSSSKNNLLIENIASINE